MKEVLTIIAIGSAFLALVTFVLHSSYQDALKRTIRCDEFCARHDGMSHIAEGRTTYCVCNNGTTVPIGR
jgi:hypothetical protein